MMSRGGDIAPRTCVRPFVRGFPSSDHVIVEVPGLSDCGTMREECLALQIKTRIVMSLIRRRGRHYNAHTTLSLCLGVFSEQSFADAGPL